MKEKTLLFVPVFLLLFSLSCSRELILPSKETKVQLKSYVRDLSEAQELAISACALLDDQTKAEMRNVSSHQCIVEANTKGGEITVDTLLYVFNYENEDGFAIINADARMDPFVCVIESGSFQGEGKSGNPTFEKYLRDAKEYIRTRAVDPDLPLDDTLGGPVLYKYTRMRYEGTYVSPLLKTKWGQRDVFGAFCPNGISGCVATATGQIMAFHEYPDELVASVEMGPYSQGQIIPLHWYFINMHVKNHTGNQYCTDYHLEISALLRDIGNMVNMYYGPEGSGSNLFNVQNALDHYGFDYSYLTGADISAILSSLNSYRPVLMGGGGPPVGHAWVADGYKDYRLYIDTYEQAYPQPGYHLVNSEFIEEVHALHINWGWNGTCDGYFNFNIYNTGQAVSYDETGGPSNDYSSGVMMIADIRR